MERMPERRPEQRSAERRLDRGGVVDQHYYGRPPSIKSVHSSSTSSTPTSSYYGKSCPSLISTSGRSMDSGNSNCMSHHENLRRAQEQKSHQGHHNHHRSRSNADRMKSANNDYHPQESDELVAGKYAPELEARILVRMKEIARDKGKKGKWKDAHEVLVKIIRVEKVSEGPDSPTLASTRYQNGVALSWLGQADRALAELKEALRILIKIDHTDAMLDLASTFFHIGMILGKMGDYDGAIYHLERAQKVETKLFGHVLEETSRLLWKLECKREDKHKMGRK